ncbi:MAG: signal peptidase I [Saezia sp.]
MDQSKLMSNITAVVLLAILAYGIALYFGVLIGDISTVMLLLTVVSFVYWVFDKFMLKPQRMKKAKTVEAQIRAANENVAPELLEQKIRHATDNILLPPWWIEWTAGFFWVILIVFTVRSFLFEPYRIPSDSMMPTLENGDFILVKKYEYGLKFPVINWQMAEFRKPGRGEVIVFDSPVEKLVLIKRIIGLPGDLIVYRDKQLTINGELVPLTKIDQYLNTLEERGPVLEPQFKEDLGDISHNILRRPYVAWRDNLGPGVRGFSGLPAQIENCTYQGPNFTCRVPEGYYFMMGDNRDYSLDSRYWGFVPEKNIIGRAFYIWLNVKKFNRIGKFN